MLCDRDSITYYPVSVKYLCQVFWNELAGQGGEPVDKLCGPVEKLWKLRFSACG